MKKVIALLLVLAMMLTMTACASDHENMVGVWETGVELAPLFNSTLGDHEGAEYLKVESLKIKLILTFNEDDTYTMVADAASVDAAMESLKKTLRVGLEEYLMDTIAATGLNLELGDIMHMLDTDMDTLIGGVLTPELIEGMTQTMAAQGQYLAEENMLYMSDSVDKEIDENIYDTYILTEDRLTIGSSTLSDETTDYMYPMVFTRVSE